MTVFSEKFLLDLRDYLNRDMEFHGVCCAEGGDYHIDLGKLGAAIDYALSGGEPEEEEPDPAWQAFHDAVSADPELSRLRKRAVNPDELDRSAGESHRAAADYWDAVEGNFAVQQLWLAAQ